MEKIKKYLNELIKKRIVILDGATGTQLYKKGMPSGICVEKWCLENSSVISQIHASYIEAGCDIIYTSTFGANRIKLSEYGISDVVNLNAQLATLAKKTADKRVLVAGDIGPTGKFIQPFGDLSFEEAVNIFKEQVKGLLLGGVDLFVVETIMDIQEARAALLAIKELSDKFVMVTMTFEKSGRTLEGNHPLSCLITLQSLGADAFGFNCSTGPESILKIIKIVKPFATLPIVAKPNAGLPRIYENESIFDMREEVFAKWAKKLALAGANFIGGCCGTGPEHIKYLKNSVINLTPKKPLLEKLAALSSATSYFIFKKNKFSIVGEKINPSGKKELQEKLKNFDFSLVRTLAKEQKEKGAQLLDVNVSIPQVDEKILLGKTILNLSAVTDLPLVIDSSNPDALGLALRIYPARALLNSISLEPKKLAKLFPLIKKYRPMCVLLPVWKKRLPKSLNERKRIIKTLIKKLKKIGYSKEDLVIDGLVLSISVDKQAAINTLKFIKWCHKLGYFTIIGLSNVSFGLPARHILNKVFLRLAKRQGLTLAIADPEDNKYMKNKLVQDFLLNKPKAFQKFLQIYAKRKEAPKIKPKIISIEQKIYNSIIDGDRDGIIRLLKIALERKINPLFILNNYMIPAIIKVGELFEKKEYFLPQLIASAETMKKGLNYLNPYLKTKKDLKEKKGLILLATVEGDVHDIGKNIVALLLENYGFKIIDLGKDVSCKRIISNIKRYNPDIVGLSALMTTTMTNMAKIILEAKKEGLNPKFMVGGAVLNELYAKSIGAEYAKDGVEAVKLANSLIKK
ncbi:MAG: homocysteine S-methyltransferase family protein [Candidatus Omnitrophica bacterium]|nr:homocysteine S-methyltransferase family protein [Candidatus Omnitrophota bacterium]